MDWSREKAEKILADQNSDQLSRDLAHIRLAEEQNAPGNKDTKYVKNICEEWARVESNERGGLISLSDERAVALAVEALLVKSTTQLHPAYNNSTGQLDSLLAYPKLVKAANKMIRTNHAKKADAHAVLGYLCRSPNRSKALQHFTMAVQIQPKNFRFRSQLASTHVAMGNLSLSLQSLLVAIDLAPAGYEKFNLEKRKAKVLFNLCRNKEAKAAFEHLLKESTKYDEMMSLKDKGHLAVCQYMLCQLYTKEKDKKNALRHWQEAEATRNSLPSELVQYLDWSARQLAQMCMGILDPSLLSHQECHNCRKLVKDPKKCSACKVALYCSKACQVQAWKGGHKRQCQQAKTDRKAEKQDEKQAAKKERNLLPLDATLDPRKLWADADKLAEENAREAVFLYLVALFMDFSLDAEDMQLAKKALAACEPDDPMVIALGMIVNLRDGVNARETLSKSQEAIGKALKDDKTAREFSGREGACIESFEQMDRFQFGVAMSLIFRGRIWSRFLNSSQSSSAVLVEDRKQLRQDIVDLFTMARVSLDPERWLTYQYELAYSHLDVAATDESKRWFGSFLTSLESVKQANGSFNTHWTNMKLHAEANLRAIPLLEAASQSGIMP